VKFADYAPPALPSPEQQRDALQKGLGRAWQWALNGRLDDEPLLEACLRDQRFDAQCEDSRGTWLWQLVQAVRGTQRFRVPILHALHELSDEGSANQLCELACCYAETGDGSFRDRLYEIVERRPFPDSAWLGEQEIVALDGEQGFLFAARLRGQQLASREWEWDDGSLVTGAIEHFGEERVNKLLDASSEVAIGRFLESWRRDKQRTAERKQAKSQKERMQAIPVEEVIRAAETDSKCYWFRVWGMHADEAELQTVLQRLWTAKEPRVLANLIKVFVGRPQPKFDARLIELCRDNDQELSRWAFRALGQNAHPLIRDFALTELSRGNCDESVVGLFIKNYRQGDEDRILEAMELTVDADELHGLLMDVVKVLEKNPGADCSRLGIIAYASTPCASCRFHAARFLMNQQAAPRWLEVECRNDAGEDCRKLVAKAT